MNDLSVFDAAWGELRHLVTGGTFHQWLEPCQFAGRDDGVILVAAPPEAVAWLQARMQGTVDRIVAGASGGEVRGVRFVPDGALLDEGEVERSEGEPWALDTFVAWLPVLGSVLWAAILVLRMRADPEGVVVLSVPDLAEAVGVSVRTLQRALSDDRASVFIRWREVRRRRVASGRWVASRTVWAVRLDDPPVGHSVVQGDRMTARVTK